MHAMPLAPGIKRQSPKNKADKSEPETLAEIVGYREIGEGPRLIESVKAEFDFCRPCIARQKRVPLDRSRKPNCALPIRLSDELSHEYREVRMHIDEQSCRLRYRAFRVVVLQNPQ